jgi:hypothetical protein
MRHNIDMTIDIKCFKQIADDEINNPQWGVTKQFLEVNTIKKVNGEYVYERYSITENQTITYHDIKNSRTDIYNYKEAAFYYKIEKEHYFYCIGVDINKKDVARVFMVNATYCHLHAYSDCMTLEEMAKLTKLKYSDGGTKGQKANIGRGFYSTSWIEYQFTKNTSYELEESLSMLLDELEKDKKGVKYLAKKTEAYIDIVKYQYVSANAGITIDNKTIKRLEELGLKIEIDMYIGGEKFIS